MSQREISICVFCGARSGNDPFWTELAAGFGARLAERGIGLVYGGGRVGLMGALASGALAASGRVVGVIPRSLLSRELAHDGLTELQVVDDMATRKVRMLEQSDAFVALPGGLGTLDELFEVLTLGQIGTHSKPSALLDARGYWQPLVGALQAMVQAGFVRPQDLGELLVQADPSVLIDKLLARLAAPAS
ncbi:MAG: TIGR00730 family Rossman fold protein [Quisquiliibacterium sp.]